MREEKEEMERLERVELAKAALKNKNSKERTGFDCVSPNFIGMHYVRPDEMYSLQFLLKQRDNLDNP